MGCVFLASAFYAHIGTYINTGYVDCNDVTIRCPLRIGLTYVSNHLDPGPIPHLQKKLRKYKTESRSEEQYHEEAGIYEMGNQAENS